MLTEPLQRSQVYALAECERREMRTLEGDGGPTGARGWLVNVGRVGLVDLAGSVRV